MPSWLGPLDVADKVASVLSLLVAVIALIVSIHFARKATGTRALSDPFSSSGGLSNAVVLEDGDGLAEVAGLART
ncbi:hypothetical protein AB0F17_60245, partial [Nonomuraea sp. NPDC026600]|uniref:hypothetical protein n=1 Tax=Nonomuraea sp. NPDC026600 TaxID=3155363 RepID=UPI0034089614